jgi:excisionase family DNA binding protein
MNALEHELATVHVQLLTIPETAAALSCSRRHVYELIARGEFRPVDIGRGRSKTRVRSDDLQEYIERRTRTVN